MLQRIFIHANNVHQGGGRSLLLALLSALKQPEKFEFYATLDNRLNTSVSNLSQNHIQWVGRSIVQRLKSEWWISRNVLPGDLLLCFGNLPPLCRSRGWVAVFLQNRYLIENIDLAGFPLFIRWRIRLERLWLLTRARNADLFVVQTPTMQRILDARLAGAAVTAVIPFESAIGSFTQIFSKGGSSASTRFDFLYVASGEPHKNHRNLIEAWCLLAKNGEFPSICLTVDARTFPDLCRWIEERASQFKLRVSNLGVVPQCEVQLLYKQVRALIFPSQLESFGLPLIEALLAGLPVLAPELDYVRDILDPEESFDPRSPTSIARAVRRFLGIPEAPLPILDAAGFLDKILSYSKKIGK